MHPMAEDVQGHGKLEEEHVLGVEVTQSATQTHGGDSVYQLVQHGAEFTGLVEHPCKVTIKRIKKSAEKIEETCFNMASWHVVERHKGKDNPEVINNIRNKQINVVSHFHCTILEI